MSCALHENTRENARANVRAKRAREMHKMCEACKMRKHANKNLWSPLQNFWTPLPYYPGFRAVPSVRSGAYPGCKRFRFILKLILSRYFYLTAFIRSFTLLKMCINFCLSLPPIYRFPNSQNPRHAAREGKRAFAPKKFKIIYFAILIFLKISATILSEKYCLTWGANFFGPQFFFASMPIFCSVFPFIALVSPHITPRRILPSRCRAPKGASGHLPPPKIFNFKLLF